MTEIQTEIDLAPKRKYKWSAHEKVRLKAMTDDGFPAMLIGKALGRSYKSVKLMQDAQSIHFKRNTKWSEKDMRFLVAEKNKGTPYNDIGIMLNRSTRAINKSDQHEAQQDEGKGQGQADQSHSDHQQVSAYHPGANRIRSTA